MSHPLFQTEQFGQANLLETAPILENAVVTKPLYQEGPVRLVLFAMDAQQVLSEHSAPMPALVHMLDGRIAFNVAGRELELASSDWLSLPPGEVHSVRALEPSRFLLTLVKRETA